MYTLDLVIFLELSLLLADYLFECRVSSCLPILPEVLVFIWDLCDEIIKEMCDLHIRRVEITVELLFMDADPEEWVDCVNMLIFD